MRGVVTKWFWSRKVHACLCRTSISQKGRILVGRLRNLALKLAGRGGHSKQIEPRLPRDLPEFRTC